jgi:hypothetical protein
MTLSKEYIIETIDMELDALYSERDDLLAKHELLTLKAFDLSERIQTLSRLIKEMVEEK